MLTDIFQQGAAAAWLYLPTAVLLGALHGLEPGHSKTMMAAFIIAVRGTVGQAVLLGLCATLSHTLIVWVVALGGMYLWQGVDAESFEPYLQVAVRRADHRHCALDAMAHAARAAPRARPRSYALARA